MTKLIFLWVFLLSFPILAEEKPKGPTLIQVLERAGHYNTLIACIQESALVDRLSKTGPYTLFAPTDEAFVRLYPGTIEKWLQPQNVQELRSVLLYHLVSGKLTLDQIRRSQTLKSLQGEILVITPGFQQLAINGATIGKGLEATNGVIYPIDEVLQPNSGETYGN